METKKIVFITGASRGIGKAIALQLAQQNYYIIGTATTLSGANAISAYLGEQGRGVVLDVCDDAVIESVYQDIVNTVGAPDILINNAAITSDNLLLRMKQDQWDSVIDTNLNAVYRMTKLCVRSMLKKNWGRVVSITSVVGVAGNPGQANYCAAKAGVIGFTKSLAQEMSSKGITFNTVAPGFIQTNMTNALTDAQKEYILNQIPMKKLGLPDDIANAVVFLVSDAAAYITGQTLHVNGGMLMV